MSETIRRACVVCGGSNGPEVYSYSAPVCGLGWIDFAIRCCSGCGMVQQDPTVAPEVMGRQYQMFSNYLAFSDGPPALPPTTNRMLSLLAELEVPAGQVYDVGAATGDALCYFRRAGWEVSGCDPSPVAVEQALERLDIRLDLGFEEECLARRSGLDLVTFSHVMEHLYDPSATLRRIEAALGPRGVLAIEVPCLTAPERNPPGLFMMEHINYFEETSIANLLAVHGFEPIRSVVTLSAPPYSFPVVTVLARKAAPRPVERSSFDHDMEFLRVYRAFEQQKWRDVDAELNRALVPGEPVFVWGAGLHTSNLLTRTGLAARHAILAVTDRDAQKHGHSIGLHAVVPPDQVLTGAAPIVISSYDSEHRIAADLQGRGIDGRRVIQLYHRFG